MRNRRPFGREHGRLRKRLGVTALVVALAAAVAVSAGAQLAATPTPLAQARALLKLSYLGTSVLPSPDKRPAAKGKLVTIISSGQNSISSAVPVAGQMEACKAIGWTCTVYDGKSDPSIWPGLVRQAIAARADGIILQAIDCPLIQQPLREAKAAGIKVVGSYAFDCADPKFKGPKLFDGQPLYTVPPAIAKLQTKLPKSVKNPTALGSVSYAYTLGLATIAKTGGAAKVISVSDPEFRIVDYTLQGFKAGLSTGPKTKIVANVDFLVSELGPALEAKVSQALLQHPEANAIRIPYTAAMLLGGASAIQKSGRAGKIVVVGTEGFGPELDLIRSGLVSFANITPKAWIGWAAVDTLNSVFIKRPVKNSGLGATLIDKAHGLPATPGTEFSKFPNYRKAYKKAWGV